MRVAVIGAGSWGTAVASIVAPKGDTILWARRPELADAINDAHQNPDYLAGLDLPHQLTATADLERAVTGAEVIVMGVPSHGFRTVLDQAAPWIDPGVAVVSLTKGLEQGSLLRMTEVVAQTLPNVAPNRIGVLTGPNLAKEIVAGQPAASVVAMPDEGTAELLQVIFHTTEFRVYTNTDVIGSEAAGAMKNVMAIGAGVASGLGYGLNALAALVTRSLAELTRLGMALGGKPLTFAGLAGMGDLIATCMSTQSRNHRVGLALGQGRKLDDIISEMKMVAEGVKTTQCVIELAERHGIDVPIASEVGAMLYEGLEPDVMVANLLGRPARHELDGIH